MFHWNIQKYIEEKQLFTLHDKVLVALSGGADSVALLRVLLVLGYHCEAAHCNFHLRGEESDRDERFVNELCKGLGVTLHVTHFDTVAYASRHHVSIEMAAREMRYDWFEQLRLFLIPISEPTRLRRTSYAFFCLKKRRIYIYCCPPHATLPPILTSL